MSTWNEEKVNAIFKKGSASDLSNYRPTSLLPFIPQSFVKNRVLSCLWMYLREQPSYRHMVQLPASSQYTHATHLLSPGNYAELLTYKMILSSNVLPHHFS